MSTSPSYTLRNKRVWIAGHRGLVGGAWLASRLELRTSFEELVAEMVEADRTILRTTGARRHEPVLHAAQ